MKHSWLVGSGCVGLSICLMILLWANTTSSILGIILGLICLSALVVLQAYIHELAHFYMARIMRARNIELHTGWRGFYVTYELQAPIKLLCVSASGPLSGVIVGGVGLWAAAVWQSHTAWAAWVTVASVLAGMQIVFLLPFAADGHTFWMSLWNIVITKRSMYETK